MIYVNKRLSVEPLLRIDNPEFANWYGHGVWWAMYGDGVHEGLCADTYLIDCVEHGIEHGWYDRLDSGWFPMLGFKLGMVHGGYLVAEKIGKLNKFDPLVKLSDSDFTKGYEVGRNFGLTEAPLENRIFSDEIFCVAVYEWAKDFPSWKEPTSTLAYVLGCRIGELSLAILSSPLLVLTTTKMPVKPLGKRY